MKITRLIGRNLLASLFVVSALYSIFYDFNGFAKAVESKNLPFPIILAILALTIKILGGLSIAFNYYSNFGTLVLLIFMLLVTPIFHNAFIDPSQFNSMMKNIAIIGGLLLLF